MKFFWQKKIVIYLTSPLLERHFYLNYLILISRFQAFLIKHAGCYGFSENL